MDSLAGLDKPARRFQTQLFCFVDADVHSPACLPLQAHLVLEESLAWLGGRFRVYWRFGKPPVACVFMCPAGCPVGQAWIERVFIGARRGSIPAARNTEVWSKVMAQVCDICGKGPQFGNNISHAHNVTRRRWSVNLQAVKALVNGHAKRIRVCTSCIKDGKIAKA